jgi:hypothetical protein
MPPHIDTHIDHIDLHIDHVDVPHIDLHTDAPHVDTHVDAAPPHVDGIIPHIDTHVDILPHVDLPPAPDLTALAAGVAALVDQVRRLGEQVRDLATAQALQMQMLAQYGSTVPVVMANLIKQFQDICNDLIGSLQGDAGEGDARMQRDEAYLASLQESGEKAQEALDSIRSSLRERIRTRREGL